MTVTFRTESDLLKDISGKVRQLRLSQNLTQKALAEKSGVSLGSLKRFETSGEISLKFLIKIACVLDCAQSFDLLFQLPLEFKSLDQVRSLLHPRKRGRKND
jgi:transcriptional regulator with XRE-family HTH domain